ncbi:hypothetical protein SAMN05216334_1302 [Nitrosomonas ureae]|uniref:Uncharacterized protein n=1 Tax=Nitrosomonas ureae TaxID=44577 RepID=A0A1H5XQ36_9PROT|nr:hypothetical protein SAMN05216334_1302 [Nitrosomonas ureae]
MEYSLLAYLLTRCKLKLAVSTSQLQRKLSSHIGHQTIRPRHDSRISKRLPLTEILKLQSCDFYHTDRH